MLRAILNKSWRQHPTRHQLYGFLPPITKTIQVRRTRHAGHCWRSRDELISDVLLWTPIYSRAIAERPAQTYIQQLCGDTGCSPKDLSKAMNGREKWRERVRDIRASGTTCWWWMFNIVMCHVIRGCLRHKAPCSWGQERTLAYWLRASLEREFNFGTLALFATLNSLPSGHWQPRKVINFCTTWC